MELEHIAYLAGIVDGEGCFGAYPTRRSERGIQLTLRIATTSPQLAAWLMTHCVGNISTRKKERGRNVFVFAFTRSQADAIVRAMLPYLVIKRAEAEAWLELSSLLLRRGDTRVINHSRRLALVEQIADLKKVA